MLGMTETQELLATATAFLVALTAFFRTVVPVNAKLNRLLDIVSHEWETNGKTGISDTVTIMLQKLDSIEERLARGDRRFDDIEHGQAEAAERGESIQASVAALRRDIEGRM